MNHYYLPIENNPVYLQPNMAEQLELKEQGTKEEKYLLMLSQIEALLEGESDLIANLANVSSVLKMTFNFFWAGFYIVKEEELVLGPFQGTLACTRIQKGKGVCGSAWSEARTILVDDVETYPNYISCDADAKSEIVVPVFDSNQKVVLVLDVDSDQVAAFDSIDQNYLESLAKIISKSLN